MSTVGPLQRGICQHIKTHNSESRGQEEAGRTQRTSELFTGSTTLKLANALNKLPLKLLLSYQGLSTFKLYRISNPTMEEIGTTNPDYQPMQVLWHPFVRPHLKNHPHGTYSLVY